MIIDHEESALCESDNPRRRRRWYQVVGRIEACAYGKAKQDVLVIQHQIDC